MGKKAIFFRGDGGLGMVFLLAVLLSNFDAVGGGGERAKLVLGNCGAGTKKMRTRKIFSLFFFGERKGRMAFMSVFKSRPREGGRGVGMGGGRRKKKRPFSESAHAHYRANNPPEGSAE